jgi:hypothetical protein
MKRLFLAVSIWAAATAASAAPTTAEGWRAAAAQDLAAVHDLLRENSPAMLTARDSAHFRQWLEAGYAQAKADLAKVTDARGYAFLLRGYATGFRDSHISVWQTEAAGADVRQPLAWPGFVVGLQDDAYRVAYRAADDTPPLGAKLVGCDGATAAKLAAARDRYDGDLSTASGRFYAASRLLQDRGNPFVARPTRCRFETAAGSRDVTLAWRPISADELKKANAAATGQTKREVALSAWGPNRWWISIPDMDDDHDWAGFYKAVQQNLAAIRASETIIVDLRGNNGGSSGYGDKLARLLWGEDLVNAREPDLGPTLWRASKVNRDYWAGVEKRLAGKPLYESEMPEVRQILAKFHAAIAAGQPSFEMPNPPPVRPAKTPGNPLRARVVLLTDHACVSACLDLMDEFLPMPNVVQAGTTTWADTIFMELTTVDALPSGMSGLAFGHKAWVKRPRGSNVPYTPTPRLTWRGDPADDAGLKTWLETRLAAH